MCAQGSVILGICKVGETFPFRNFPRRNNLRTELSPPAPSCVAGPDAGPSEGCHWRVHGPHGASSCSGQGGTGFENILQNNWWEDAVPFQSGTVFPSSAPTPEQVGEDFNWMGFNMSALFDVSRCVAWRQCDVPRQQPYGDTGGSCPLPTGTAHTCAHARTHARPTGNGLLLLINNSVRSIADRHTDTFFFRIGQRLCKPYSAQRLALAERSHLLNMTGGQVLAG